MDNQHQKIKGYRDLTQGEIDLINEIKEEGARLELLCAKVRQHVSKLTLGTDELSQSRNPGVWAAMGAIDLQTGLMALVRAVARPASF